jgi:SAM-dependent methyltransferase
MVAACAIAELPVMSFDRLANSYRWMERVLAGRTLQACRTDWLGKVLGARDILIVGEGPGRFLEVCAERCPKAQFTVVDSSQKMLELAKLTWEQGRPRDNRAEFIHAALPDWRAPRDRFDLVVTHFFLDCFNDRSLRLVVELLAASASANSSWLLSDFCVPPRGLARWRAQCVLRIAYTFFRAATGIEAREITPPEPFLEAAGYHLKERKARQWGLLHSDLWLRIEST